MKKLIGLLAFTMLFVLSSDAQNYFDIRLSAQSINCETNEVCYDVQIKSGNDRLWRFAGQNYRLFYNGALAEFTSVEGHLPVPYTQPEVVQNIQHLDLSAEGNLSFDSDISWLNYYIDMNTAQAGQILSSDVWTTTSTICFTSEVDLMENPDLCFEMVWAREDLTFNYATAFVEVSEWVEANSTNDNVHGMEYHDLNVDNGDIACFAQTCAGAAPSYDSKVVLKSTDTLNNISCYAIQIKSSNSRFWTLGNRQISLLYDGSQASFQSAQSSISGSGLSSVIDRIDNLSFSNGSGNVSFEDDLSAISIAIEQDTDNLPLGNSYIEVAEVCLDFSNSSGTSECFEIVIGRSGLTEEYFGEITEIYTGEDNSLAIANAFTDYNKCASAPCPELNAPISKGDVRICEGEVLPFISVQEIQGYEIRWYTTPVGGVPIAQGATYEPESAGMYYAETYDENLNCYSEERTAVALLEVQIPSLEIISKACEEDENTYTLIFTTDANTVNSDIGTLEKQIGLEWMVSDIPSGLDVKLRLTNIVTLCERIETIEAPNCECLTVSAPVSQGSKVVCLDDNYPTLSVEMVQENVTADWYTRVEGGTPLITDQLEYTPNNILGTGVYTYYVESRSLENGCVSGIRTEITLTVLDPPVYAFVGSNCTEDLQFYTATFYSDATIIQTTEGIISDDGNGVWNVSQIPAGVNTNLTITSPTGCMISKEISAPSCECDDIEAPICRGQIVICEGIDYEGFVAFVPEGYLIRWYGSELEGSHLAEGETFKPSLPGKYYAEAVDSISGCVSMERAEVELVINPVPNLQVVHSVLCVGDTVVWNNLVVDLDSTIGSTAVFANFGDALHNENPLAETSVIINEIEAYFFRKTTDAGCFDIETIIVVPEDCGNTCLAEAGTYEASEEVCFDGEFATLSVVEVDQATIPTGYSEIFILSVGDEKVISHGDLIPEFVVDAPGLYRIHSGVFDPTDMGLEDIPEDLNTIDEFIGYFANEGSDICIAIDPVGVLFDVATCTDACGAYAGSPIAGEIDCLGENPIVLNIEMNPLDILIPEGFQQIFVLTSGPELIIMGAQAEVFSVDTPGEYRVHSLVFDPLTLDLGFVEPGVTTGFDVFNLLLEGGGDICASLDLNGALFNVTECITECLAESGNTLAVSAVCFDGTPVELNVDVSDEQVVPEGYVSSFLITEGNDFIVIGLQPEPFEISSPGDYEVNSIVYNPATFDESLIEFGVTDFFDVNSMLTSGGGQICGSMDFFGATFFVEECDIINEDVDLELSKEINNSNPSIGEEVTFTISVFNNSENMASGVAIADRLPSGYSLSGNISDGGISETDNDVTEILWAEVTILPMTTERLTFTAIVNSGGGR